MSMRKFGSASVIPPNSDDPSGTIATVGLYGPRGGNTPFAVLDRISADKLIDNLEELLPTAQRKTATYSGVSVSITRSAIDGAIVVFVDTDEQLDGEDGSPSIRVRLNDEPIYVGRPIT